MGTLDMSRGVWTLTMGTKSSSVLWCDRLVPALRALFPLMVGVAGGCGISWIVQV